MNKRQKKKLRSRGYHHRYKDFKKGYNYTCYLMNWNKKDKRSLNNYIAVKDLVKFLLRTPYICKFEPELVQRYNPDFAMYYNCFKYGNIYLKKTYISKIILKEGELINGEERIN